MKTGSPNHRPVSYLKKHVGFAHKQQYRVPLFYVTGLRDVSRFAILKHATTETAQQTYVPNTHGNFK